MRVAVALVVSAFVLAPVPALAEDAPAASAKAKEEKSCRLNKMDTGSRLGRKKVCRTAAQWAAEDLRTSQTRKSLSGR